MGDDKMPRLDELPLACTLVATDGAARLARWRALTDAKPSGDNAYKIELARRIVIRALTLAAAGTPARIPALPASPFASTSGAIHA